ncbi:hypothetical protein P3S68_003814 [Capsicum galapagoense]
MYSETHLTNSILLEWYTGINYHYKSQSLVTPCNSIGNAFSTNNPLSLKPHRTKIEMASRFFVLGLLLGICLAADPSPLQDFCVTDSTISGHLNGKVCKDPKKLGRSPEWKGLQGPKACTSRGFLL